MTSTRDKNFTGDYRMQMYSQSRTFELVASPINQIVCFPGDGIQGSPGINACQLSKNAVDIESFLRGTRLTDLTQNNGDSGAPPVLLLNNISSLHLYKNSREVIMPKNLTILSNQRPLLS
jgi:hypothetical protein